MTFTYSVKTVNLHQLTFWNFVMENIQPYGLDVNTLVLSWDTQCHQLCRAPDCPLQIGPISCWRPEW